MQAVNNLLAELGVRASPAPMRMGGRIRRTSAKVVGESKAERRLRRKTEKLNRTLPSSMLLGR